LKPKRCTAQYPFTGTFQNGARCTLEVGHSGLHTIIQPSGMDYAPDDEPRPTVPSAAPCPFCGCTATIIETVEPRDPEPIYHAECWRCGARGPVEDANDKALASWNLRIAATLHGEHKKLAATEPEDARS